MRPVVVVLMMLSLGGLTMKAGDEWKSRGVSYVRGCLEAFGRGELALSAYEETEAYRSLRLLGASPRVSAREAGEDVMGDRLRVSRGEMESLVTPQWDGGWSSEAGAVSELSSTLAGLGHYLDYAGLSGGRLAESGYGHLRRWCRGGVLSALRQEDGGEPPLRLELSFLRLLCQLWRAGVLEDRACERELDALVSRLRGQVDERLSMGEGRGLYELALLAQALCLLGRGDELANASSRLLQGQRDDGSWREEGLDDAQGVLTTCAVLLALQGLTAAPSSGEVQWCQLDCRESASGLEVGEEEVSTVLEAMYDDVEEPLTLTLTAYDASGKVVGHLSDSGQAGRVSLWHGHWPPGEYEVCARLWWQPSGVLASERRRPLVVRGWHEVSEFRLLDAGVPRMLQVGEEVTLRPDVLVEFVGNEACAGVLTAELVTPSGRTAVTSDPLELDSAAPSLDRVYHLEDMPYAFTEVGYHELTLRLRLSDGEERCVTSLFYVEDGLGVRLENALEPLVLPVDLSSGWVRLRVGLQRSQAESGVPASFAELPPQEADNRPGARPVSLTLSGIVNGRGQTLLSGWLVVRADYGRCVGGVPLSEGDVSLTAHEIVSGQCRFEYCSGENGFESVTPLRLYAGMAHGGHIEQLDCIGVIEMVLHGDRSGVMQASE